MSRHRDLDFVIPDEWWGAAKMENFVPRAHHYRAAADSRGRRIVMLRLSEIDAAHRLIQPGDTAEHHVGAASQTWVIAILSAIRRDAPLPPIEVRSHSNLPWTVTDGALRFYCSIACGFTHIPAVVDAGR